MTVRTLRIQYRATPAEARRLEKLARAWEMTTADVLRRLVREATETQKEEIQDDKGK